MPTLIDADALEAYIKDYACIPCKEYGADKDGIRCDFCGFGFCLEGIKRHTAHDAEPVRHGRWEEQNHHDWEYSKEYRCSECGMYRLVTVPNGWNWNYCPNCGAKMDEVEDEE